MPAMPAHSTTDTAYVNNNMQLVSDPFKMATHQLVNNSLCLREIGFEAIAMAYLTLIPCS